MCATARVIEVKERLEGDFAGQGFKFEIDLSPLARCPGVKHLIGQLDHGRDVRLHAGLEERGLNKLALPMPKCTFAGHESVSEHRLERSRSEVLDVVLGICH